MPTISVRCLKNMQEYLQRNSGRTYFKTLKSKIIVIFIFLVTIQIIGIALFGTFTLRPYITGTYKVHQEKMADALHYDIRVLKEKIENYSVSMIGDAQIQAFLEKANIDGNSESPIVMPGSLRYSLLAYTDYDNQVKAIYLIDNYENIYSTSIDFNVRNYLLGKKASDSPGSAAAVWTTDYQAPYVILYRVVNNNTTNLTRKIGSLCLMVDESVFLDMMDQFRIDTKQKMILQNTEGTFRLGDVEAFDTIKQSADGFENYLVEKRESDGWQLYSWVDTGTVFAPVRSLVHILAVEILIFVIFTVVLFIFLSGRITRPISQMRKAMREIAGGNMQVQVPVASHDEIGELAGTLNRMSVEINHLVEEIRRDQKYKQILELRALQYQINPHFLYNALDSINMYARKNNDNDCTRMVTDLSSFFRIFLSQGNDFIRLKEEVEGVEYYLHIQKIRFPDQFEWSISIEKELEEIRVMKFILQPIVENSISHGILGQVEKGMVSIKAYRENDKIVIQVEDNGIGMLPPMMEKLLKTLDVQEMEEKNAFEGGFAMRNVHQRLKLFYGEDCGLSVDSEWEEGTVITIRIPWEQPLC